MRYQKPGGCIWERIAVSLLWLMFFAKAGAPDGHWTWNMHKNETLGHFYGLLSNISSCLTVFTDMTF